MILWERHLIICCPIIGWRVQGLDYSHWQYMSVLLLSTLVHWFISFSISTETRTLHAITMPRAAAKNNIKNVTSAVWWHLLCSVVVVAKSLVAHKMYKFVVQCKNLIVQHVHIKFWYNYFANAIKQLIIKHIHHWYFILA